jgi:putative nucleotidyltransferase-like protein
VSAAAPAPPFRATAAALRATTERLALELRDPQSQPPDWNRFEWDVARAVTTLHGIAALLRRRLQWRGPELFDGFLAHQYDHSLRREARVDALLARVDSSTRAAGVSIVALKGAALRDLQLYAPGERPMGDLDLLARAAEISALRQVLNGLGYQELYRTRRHVTFSTAPPAMPHGHGEHIGNPLTIEVHTRVAEPLPVSYCDITNRLAPLQETPGINPYRNHAALLAHLLLHAAGNMRAHALRLVQLVDIARLLPRLSDADWNGLLEIEGERVPHWALPPLLMTQRYFDVAAPNRVLEILRAACPPLLAHVAPRYSLMNVSWSNLRISAFPGIEWSRSAGEALRFARSRIAPGKTAREELRLAGRVQPQVAAIPWYDQAHRTRVLRWIFSRPPRVQTQCAVMAALDSGSQSRHVAIARS